MSQNNDLISRSALLNERPEYLNTDHIDVEKALFAKGWNACAHEYYSVIDNAPAVDAEVVRHGQWKPYYEPMECFVDVYLNTEIRDVHVGWICSECGRYEQHGTTEEMPYCHCGAKMDAEVQDGTE